MPVLAAFLNLVVAVTLLILALYAVRSLWVKALPARGLVWLIAPGVAVHELSHALACLLTGAKVHSMVLFRSDGSGEVRHGPPKLRYVGDLVIGLAPLLGGSLCLLVLAMLLKAPVNPLRSTAGVQPDQLHFLLDLAALVIDDLRLYLRGSSWTDWRTYVFLYFAICFGLTMAPSGKDLKNATVGILVVCGGVLIAHLVIDRLIEARGDGMVFRFVADLLITLHYPFSIAAIAAIIGGLIYLAAIPLRKK